MICTLVIVGLIGRSVEFSSAQFAEAEISSTDGGSSITGDSYCTLPQTEIDLKQLDEHWFGRTGATTCAEPNQLSLQQLLGDVGIKQLANTQFPDVTPLTPDEVKCVLLDDDNGTFPNGSPMSLILQGCTQVMIPGAAINNIFNASEPTVDDLLRSSQGLMIDPNTKNTVSMCKQDMPCKKFNEFLVNGTLQEAAVRCGCGEKMGNNHNSADFNCSAQLGAEFQNTSNGRSDYCYNMLDQNATGVHGPMFGSIYWINAFLAYSFGDLDGLGHMPGCRVECNAHKMADNKGSCTNPVPRIGTDSPSHKLDGLSIEMNSR